MNGTVLMVLTPVALLLGSAVGTRVAGLDARRDLGLRWPRTIGSAAVALVAFLAVAAASEMLYRHWGLESSAGEWRGRYSAGALLVRIAFVALIYPVAEEVFFRGFVFGRLRQKAGEVAALLGSSVFFALLHFQYDWRGMVLVLIDGLFYGLVRSRTNSTLLTIALHILGNGFAVWQRL